jgi:hypothetical protein
MAPRVVGSLIALKQVAPRAQTRGELIQPLGGSLLTRGLWYRAKLKNILGDFRDRPGVWSSLQDHIGFHDLATDWPQRFNGEAFRCRHNVALATLLAEKCAALSAQRLCQVGMLNCPIYR